LSTRFQAIVSADSGQIVGAELLLRWKTEAGEISPAVFIPIAEMTGSIVPIGTWVFREACRAEAAWRLRWQERAPYVSVNLSTRQLNEANLADEFAAIMEETGANPARILLEITETALMADVETNLRILRQLADKGLRVAVDDFGTGYSSLSQLSKLPVSVLKIDKAFVDGIDKSPENRAIVQAIIGLGRSLKLKLVAEGVETREQFMELEAYGCDLLQGYYFSRPLEADAFVGMVEGDNASCLNEHGASLYFLIYASRAAGPMSADALAAFRQRVIRANRSNGITGCLIHQEGQYLQMLEGREEAVQNLLEKIRLDPQHSDLKIVIQGPAKYRVFKEWGMVFNGFDAKQTAADFHPWRKRRISLLDLAEDAQTCYAFLTAYSGRR
jgi:EAL domain-containing protein (putative c-di-GMP-specific phosphodiesterase class I)